MRAGPVQQRSVQARRAIISLPPLLACRPLGQVQTVCVIDLGAARLFTGHDLTPVSTAEAVVLTLLGHFLFCLFLHGDPPLSFLQL